MVERLSPTQVQYKIVGDYGTKPSPAATYRIVDPATKKGIAAVSDNRIFTSGWTPEEWTGPVGQAAQFEITSSGKVYLSRTSKT